MTTLVRSHRGSLAGSMKEMRSVENCFELMALVQADFPGAQLEDSEITHYGYDRRFAGTLTCSRSRGNVQRELINVCRLSVRLQPRPKLN